MRNVSLCAFVCVMGCMKRMGVSGMRVMSRDLVMTCCVVSGRFLMVLHSQFMVLSRHYMVLLRRMMVLRCFLSHVSSSLVAGRFEASGLWAR
jgi:hypothetical protein